MNQLEKILSVLDKTMDKEDAQGLVYTFLAKYSESYLNGKLNNQYYEENKEGDDKDNGTC